MFLDGRGWSGANLFQLVEATGYIGRIVSAKQGPDGYTLGPYIVQSTLVLVAPALFAASIYMELGKISQLVQGDSHLLVRRRWLTRIFVVGDVISFLTQGAGGGLMASAKSSQTGSNIVVAGLFVQVIFFGCFVIVAFLFHWRLRRKPTHAILEEQPPYRRHMFVLYTASLLIFLRSIVRIVEFIQGFSGYIISHEIYLYTFDALPMLVTVLLMNLVHPSELQRLLQRRKKNGEDYRALRLSRSRKADGKV